MTALTTSSGGFRASEASNIDRVIRLSTAAAVLAVAGIAAYVSYWHVYAVVRAHGESGITARLEPATIDGLVYASSMVILYAARHRVPAPSLARWLLGLGIAATLTANMAQGWSHGPVGAVVAAWPAVSLVGSYELLIWLIRSSRALEQEPPGQHGHVGAELRFEERPVRATAVDGGQHGRNDLDLAARDSQLDDQPVRRPAIPSGVPHGDGVLEADADNCAAVAKHAITLTMQPNTSAAGQCSDESGVIYNKQLAFVIS